MLASCGLNNTMYNARKYFRTAQGRALNANGKPTNQAVQEYTKAIQKCGIILSNPKTTRNTDDALFLMAQALYLKGNSAFQAKDQFETLISGFPDSPFFGEAHISLAKVLREINRKDDAEKLLTDFINDTSQRKLHPRALFTLAEFEIADKDIIKAQYWLERIISGYPKSDEYREAFLLFGKNYYLQKDYAASLEQFEKLAQQRSIPQPLKLEARYYIALNQFMLGDAEQSWKTVNKLLSDEDRPDRIAQARVLKARLMFARNDGQQGIDEMAAISSTYPRTASSSDAQYYLGEYLFHGKQDLNAAFTAYNRVKSEFSASELAESASLKAAAITQLKQATPFEPEANVQTFIDYQITGAENYFNSFALSDSALVMYQRVIDSRPELAALLDSLSALMNKKTLLADSLRSQIELLPAPVMVDSHDAEEKAPDSDASAPDLGETTATADSEKAEPDSVFVPTVTESGEIEVQADESVLEPDKEDEPVPGEADIAAPGDMDVSLESPAPALETGSTSDSTADSLETIAIADSSSIDIFTTEVEDKEQDPATQRSELETRLTSLESELDTLADRRENLSALLQRFDREIIPLALFSQASIHSKAGSDSLSLAQIHARMLTDFPDNKYTIALGKLIAGEPVSLVDPLEQEQESLFEQAVGYADTQPDSLVAILNSLIDSDFSQIRLRSNFRLGWHYTFEQADTTLARAYLDEALKLQQTGDYAALIARFYDGEKFKLDSGVFADSLDLAGADSLAASADSTATDVPPEEEKTEEEKTELIPVGEETEKTGPEPATGGEPDKEQPVEETPAPSDGEPELPVEDLLPPEDQAPPPGEDSPE